MQIKTTMRYHLTPVRMPDSPMEGEEGSKSQCHMWTYAISLHVLHMYPKTENTIIKLKEKEWRSLKYRETTDAGEDVEKWEHSYTVGGSVN